jgi:hypothetical protein
VRFVGPAVATVSAALLLAGCSGSSAKDDPSSTPTSSAASSPPTAGAPRSLDDAADPLPRGRYTKPGFGPALSFRVGTGWHAVQDAAGFFDVEQRPGTLDVVAVQFARFPGTPTAADVLGQLRTRDGLQVGDATAIRIGGAPATRVVVDNADPDLHAQRFTEALSLEAGPLSIASGRRLQIDLVDTPDGLLAVLVGGSVRQWARTEQLAAPVVRSVRLLPS